MVLILAHNAVAGAINFITDIDYINSYSITLVDNILEIIQ